MGATVQAFDLGDPSMPPVPVWIGRSDVLPGQIHDVVASHGLVFVAHDGGLTELDARDPERMPVADAWPTRGGAGGVALSDYYAYVSASGQTMPSDLVLDVADAREIRFANHFGSSAPKHDVAIAGRWAYATENTFLEAFDLADPAFPVKVDRLYVDDYALGVYADESHVFMGRSKDLVVLDAKDPRVWRWPAPPVPPIPTNLLWWNRLYLPFVTVP